MTSNIPTREIFEHVSQTAVKNVIGHDNSYVKKLLFNRLTGYKKKYESLPLSEVFCPPDRTAIKNELQNDIDKYQTIILSPTNVTKDVQKETSGSDSKTNNQSPHVIVDVGSFISDASSDNTSQPQTIDVSNNQVMSKWIINTILQEKLAYREVLERSEKWKTINGILAGVLPIVSAAIVEIITYYINKNTQSCSN